MSVASEQNICDVHLHAEIEVLKQALVEKQNQLIAMETACLRESDRQVELEDSIIAWQDKYDRLYESHKRVQKVNQSLEDKLLKLVDRNSGERAQLTSDVATLSVRLAQANYNIAKLQREIERYKADINLAIQLLQCKPDSFVPQKVSSLPMDIQSKVSSYMRLETNSHSDSEGSTSGVGVATSGSYKVLPASDSPPPICPFPPTAMVYSMRGIDAQNSECINNNISDQMISPSIMVKYLEDELKASEIKHCDTCKCSTKDLTVLADEPRSYSIGTQTVVQGEGNSLCLRCNSNLNSPSRTNSPYIMKLVKSSDSVISETKSSVSDINDGDKLLFTPAKKDDLMVNPILSHHRLCDRTSISKQNQQFCDTAKYIVENTNRKLDGGDLIDLGKYNNNSKSLNAAVSIDISSSYNRNLSSSDKILTDASRKSDSSNLLVDTGVEGVDNNSIQGKGDIISVDDGKKSDPQVHQENGSSGYSSAEKGNLQTTITGSTNSLWSKTSSCEGAKIFENFNRNLIKTIKAENPKYRGPRLCALRIQNGSNNILLDNIESADVTPIVYTRRQRFLDEELDDNKDIITSKISMVMNNSNPGDIPSLHSALKLSTTDHKMSLGLNNNNDNGAESNAIDSNKTENENCCDAIHSKDSTKIVVLGLDYKKQDNGIVSSIKTISNPGANQYDTNNGRKLGTINTQAILTKNNCLEQQFTELKILSAFGNISQHQEGSQDLNFDLLTSCDNSGNTKSCTQSSSISTSGADVDLQENAIMRRQQLTRVAEWVQNNTQQMDNISNNPKSLSNNNSSCSSFLNANLNNNCSINRDVNSMPALVSLNNNSMEILSADCGYKITQEVQNGIVCTTSNDGQLINKSALNPLYCHAQLTGDNKLINIYHPSDSIAQNNFLLNRKYYFDEFAQNASQLHNQQKHKQFNGGKDDANQQVDLAQMEYNVKQFLLKQNEWSIRNKSANSSIISTGKTSTVVNKYNSNGFDPVTIKTHPRRTETNL